MAVVDASRNLLHRRRFSNLDTEGMKVFLKSLKRCQLTVEATASYEWFVGLAEPIVKRIVLAHPGKLRIIAQSTRKSDNLDARVLAEMLALDQIPASYRPTPRQREHRMYVRHRQYLQRKITAIRNKMRRLLSNHNQDRADLFTRQGIAYMTSLDLPAADRFCLEQLRDQWMSYRMQLKQANDRLKEFAAEGGEEEQKDRELLQTIPGVGIVTTDVVLSELADWQRFSSLKKATAYAGIAPGQRESAGKRKALHIEKAGSALLRWALVQSAWQLARRSPYWWTVYKNLKERTGSKKAIIAVARRLLGVCYSVLKHRQPYVEQRPVTKRKNQRKTSSKTRSAV
jgi:transposase